ncbi:MAG: S-methyl-5'-thioinosine phosphorylase [Chromatiales bacterium]|nr:S-methyl-5'-thioinosine phosphorylase [Gammaproteobacteria bacterium]MBW6476865.1 S-methyl-5'-thioinosine phosphorylase [Chromatiales bacterium]
MATLAIIGGTGLTSLKDLHLTRREVMHTPYGEPSAPLVFGEMCGKELLFLPRHGAGHTIPPHKINYRANLWALKESGVEKVIAVNAVGAIRADMTPGKLVVPDQIIDYTWSRTNTFFEEGLNHVTHIDFTEPYSAALRKVLIDTATDNGIEVIGEGTYAATQGPRLETTAEINKLERDGCDLVGMTGMPEAALARELELDYVCLAVVANMGAGRGEPTITMAMIEHYLGEGMARARQLLEQVVPRLV